MVYIIYQIQLDLIFKTNSIDPHFSLYFSVLFFNTHLIDQCSHLGSIYVHFYLLFKLICLNC